MVLTMDSNHTSEDTVELKELARSITKEVMDALKSRKDFKWFWDECDYDDRRRIRAKVMSRVGVQLRKFFKKFEQEVIQ